MQLKLDIESLSQTIQDDMEIINLLLGNVFIQYFEYCTNFTIFSQYMYNKCFVDNV